MAAITKDIALSKLQTNSGQITGLPKNPRLIKDDKYKKLIKSIQDDPEMLSLRELIVMPQNGHYIVIAGNMRLKAMQELNFKSAPCKVLEIDTPVEKLKAYTIKDNIGYGEHEWDSLVNEWDIEQLQDWGLDIPDFVLAKEAHEDDYEIPDEIETDIVTGDLFEIGQHRLLCGDSTKADDVSKVLDGGKPDMTYADPPYGVEIVNVNSKKVGGGGMTKFKGSDGASNFVAAKQYSRIEGDETTDTAKRFYQLCIGNEFKNIILWGGNYYSDFVPISKCWFVWDKEMTGNFSEAEMAWTSFNKGGIRVFKYLWNGLSREGNRKLEGLKRIHPTQKPVGLAMMIFQRFDLLKTVFDGFLGSGTTMVAAHQLNRKCYGIEIDPKYCQIIIDRMLKLDPSIEIKKNGELLSKEQQSQIEGAKESEKAMV